MNTNGSMRCTSNNNVRVLYSIIMLEYYTINKNHKKFTDNWYAEHCAEAPLIQRFSVSSFSPQRCMVP